jgi:stage II sporulation protein P
MFRSRKRESTGSGLSFITILLAVALVAAALLALGPGGDGLGKAGEGAAFISALLSMPGAGLEVLTERFREELYEEPPASASSAAPGVIDADWYYPPDVDPIPEPRPPESDSPSAPGDTPERLPLRIPKIPERYAAPLVGENYAGNEEGAWIKWQEAYIKNDTERDGEEVLEILEEPWAVELADPSDPARPQVLIVHTHATEGFEKYDRGEYDVRNTWRSTDNASNMVAVGAAMARVLEENNIAVLHDTTQHDYPSYNGSYERSAKTIREYLKEYPSIKVVLDLHRDAIQRGDAIVKPVAAINGRKAAQIMIIASCDDGSVGVPEWRENLRFAALFQDHLEESFPGLTRPVLFDYRKYNMDLTTGSLLVEFGSNANTLEEAVYSAEMAGEALSGLIWEKVR